VIALASSADFSQFHQKPNGHRGRCNRNGSSFVEHLRKAGAAWLTGRGAFLLPMVNASSARAFDRNMRVTVSATHWMQMHRQPHRALRHTQNRVRRLCRQEHVIP
jgi:hypothetical protein